MPGATHLCKSSSMCGADMLGVEVGHAAPAASNIIIEFNICGNEAAMPANP